MPPLFKVTPPPPPHLQGLMPKGRYCIPGSSLRGQMDVQDSGVDRYYNPPPRQEQQQQQQLRGFFERSHEGFDQRHGVGVGPQRGARDSIPISQARAHGVVGRIGVGVPAPLSALSFPLDTTQYYLLGQLEYYLSPRNMARDFYLRKQVCFLLFFSFCFFSCFCFCFFFAFLLLNILLLTFPPPRTDGHPRMDTYTPHCLIQPRAAAHRRRTH